MTLEDAKYIIEMELKWEDISCSCHLNPPCGKCVSMPSDDLIKEATKLLEDNNEEY